MLKGVEPSLRSRLSGRHLRPGTCWVVGPPGLRLQRHARPPFSRLKLTSDCTKK